VLLYHTSEAHPSSERCVGTVTGIVGVTFLTCTLVEAWVTGTLSNTT